MYDVPKWIVKDIFAEGIDTEPAKIHRREAQGRGVWEVVEPHPPKGK